MELDVARIQALGLPALAWHYMPRRRFSHLALAAWFQVESFAEQAFNRIGATLFNALVLGSPLSAGAPSTSLELGLVAFDGKELVLIPLTTSFSQNPDSFSLKSPQIAALGHFRPFRLPIQDGILANCKVEPDLVSLEVNGTPPYRILFPEAYLTGNRREGFAIAEALQGKPTPPTDYRAAYDALEKGTTYPLRADLHLIVPATTPYERLAAELIAKILPGDESQVWLLPPQLSATRVQNAIAAFANDAPPESVLALLDTTLWGTGESGFLLTTKGFYYKISGAFFGDWSKSWHQGVQAWWQVEDIVLDQDLEGRILSMTLVDGHQLRIPCGKTDGLDSLGALLNQMAYYNEHCSLAVAK